MFFTFARSTLYILESRPLNQYIKNFYTYAPTVVILCLLIGFMFNRVVSNVGFLLAGVYALSRIKDISWLFRDRWMWTFGAMAFLPLIYDIVQQGIGFYEERGIMKMVLILFPSFVFAFSPDKKQISIVHKMVILMMCLSSFYTLSQYFINAESILLSYKVSKVMPVLSYGDHIRISWLTVISMVMALFEWRHTTSRNYKILLVVYFIFQYIFIHLLSAKTGLITLYATVAIVSFYLIPKNKMWWLIFIYTLVVACGIVAIQKIPSLKERVNFMSYDFEHYSKGEYREGLSDAIRFFSLKAGKDIIVSHPILGVGFSKLQHETSLWYDANMPQVAHKERFIPSSQLVIYWASSGILGLIIFLLHVLYPLFRPFMRLSVWFMAFFIPAVLSFSYETHLEGQLPLFVYSFFTAWFWYLATRKVID